MSCWSCFSATGPTVAVRKELGQQIREWLQALAAEVGYDVKAREFTGSNVDLQPGKITNSLETSMSRLVAFYRGQGTDTEGRTLAEVWQWSDRRLEDVHDFIQWLFPLTEAGRFNPNAPLVTQEDIATFAGDEQLRTNLLRSFERIQFGLTTDNG